MPKEFILKQLLPDFGMRLAMTDWETINERGGEIVSSIMRGVLNRIRFDKNQRS
jgi:hypothetical protein